MTVSGNTWVICGTVTRSNDKYYKRFVGDMLVGDDRPGHDKFLPGICDMIWHLPAGEGDVWVFDDGKSEPALKYEIKELGDFLNRVRDDTLNFQLVHVDGLILIGEDDPLFGSPWDFEKFQDTLNGINDHTKVYRVKDPAHLGRFLRRREAKIKEGNYGLIVVRKKKSKEYPSMVEALTNIDDDEGRSKVSYVLAQRIYEAFDSLEDMVLEARRVKLGELSLEKSRFYNIEKVGKVISQRVVEWATRKWPRKQSKLPD